ncbi:PhzF family phenazine biosynthesis protein [Longirhabdus pacifica]|uniref:PhzF family phenazine biosynthesis protein n=1 Tax=Longirhabdus pacifica TaxID=2305227 RepID=UPI0010091884|nr:PhzF family phenazine biosynthesis protein [Longirhabdus pacifica]
MRKIRVYQVDAFTDKKFSGNAAGVVLDGDELSVKEMQHIAAELNQSETVFLLKTKHHGADYKVKYYTPKEEINFCGHATVALGWLLATHFRYGEIANEIILETNIGLVPLTLIKEEQRVVQIEMTQIAPEIKEINMHQTEAASLLGIQAEDIHDDYPIKLASTGNWHLLIPVKNQSAIDHAKPNFTALADHNRKYGISTTHLFTFQTDEAEYDLYTRDFLPAIGLQEDPVTGAANGALAGYLMKEGFLDAKMPHHLTIGQGNAMGRPGTLHVNVEMKNNQPVVKVAGSAVVVMEGTLML